MKMTVISTRADESRLKELIESTRCSPGYGFGLDVVESREVEGKYSLIEHDGLQNITERTIRIIGNDMIFTGISSKMENLLRENKIGFAQYSGVEIPDPNKRSLKLDINGGKPELVYNPQ